MNVLGVDVSSHAIDLILLNEETDHCTWTHLPLEGPTSFSRLRQVHDAMPTRSWYDDHGVYLIAIETPKTRFMPSAAALFPIYGAVTAMFPRDLEVWDVAPTAWRAELGLKGNAKKPAVRDVVKPLILAGHQLDPATARFRWTQDAVDAFAIAYYARQVNARGLGAAA